MEDAHTTLLEVEGAEGTAFFAVYDGHGGILFNQHAQLFNCRILERTNR